MTSLHRFAFLFVLPLLTLGASAQDDARDSAPTTPAPVESATADRLELAQRIETHLAAHHELGQLNGAVLVADGGEVVYRGAFGVANADWDVPNTLDTKFRLASVSKQFTAMLVLLLVEEGLIELDAPITRYLPDYPQESGDRVTIHHLLNHTSGIPSYTDRPDFMRRDAKHALPVDEFVATYCSDSLEFEPGTQYHYNNSAYFLLGAIVEEVTERSYAQALRERVFEPLGMTNTGCDDQDAVLPKRATGYTEVLGSLRVAPWMDMSTPYAAGALYSTVDDLWTWDRALRDETLLGGELAQRMFTPGLENYGYGWEIERADTDDPLISHMGGMPGVSTGIFRVPTRGRCVIVLCNTNQSLAYPAAMGVFEILDGGTPRPPRRNGDVAIAWTILEDGIDAGLEFCSDTVPHKLLSSGNKTVPHSKRLPGNGGLCGSVSSRVSAGAVTVAGRSARPPLRRNPGLRSRLGLTHLGRAEPMWDCPPGLLPGPLGCC